MNGESNGLVEEPIPMSIDDQPETITQPICNEESFTSSTNHQNQVNNEIKIKSNEKKATGISSQACEPEAEKAESENKGNKKYNTIHTTIIDKIADNIVLVVNNIETENNGNMEAENNTLVKNTGTENKPNSSESVTLSIQNIINGEVEGNIKDKLSDHLDTIKESQEIVVNNNTNKNSEPDVDNSNKNDDERMEINDDSLQPEKGLNGIASPQDSDNESCHYVDDPKEDPISTGENNAQSEYIENEKQDNKDNEDRKKPGIFEIVAIKRYDTSDENSLDSIEEQEAHDTVNLTSGDDESSNDSSKCNDVIVIDNENTDKKNGHPKSPEIHEIGSDISDNDDCVVTAVEKLPKTPKGKKNARLSSSTKLRRSSRAVKRTERYSDVQKLDDSDDEIQEVHTGGGDVSQAWKAKNLKIISNLNASKAAKRPKLMNSKTAPNNSSSTKSSKSLCQTMAARGISITPANSKNVEAKNTSIQVAPAPAPAPILPTLTDDMFVVEAPSFIVPYVYEKPASIAFKQFVDDLGKQLEEERAKEAKEALERKIAEKAKRQQERQEKKDRGEDVEESEEELSPEELEKKKAEKAERRERRRRKKDEDDASWDGASEESEDDDISDDDSQTKEPDVVEDVPTPVTDSYFNHSLGKFFMDIGSNLIQEYVQNDLLRQENRKLRRENRAGHDNRRRKASIAQLTRNLELSQKANESYKFELKKCKFCSFKTESTIAMAFHMETPHMINNMFICNFCSVEPQNTQNIVVHMDEKHGVKARLERPLPPHQCVNCPFEDHGKGKLARHLIACAKRFKPETNLAPPIDWEHPAKIPKLTKVRPVEMYNPLSIFGRARTGSVVGMPIAPAPRIAPRPPIITPVRLPIENSAMRPAQINVPKSVPPVPRPVKPVQPISAANAKGVVMCEICDGYIKDLEQLRNHMQWIHRIKIHPKMIYNRPPLNCQKCQFKFFTDQGLERHLLGSHGLVTSAIQEAANKGKDSGRCPVCGRAYQRKLLAHVSRDHNMVLKPAHLSYKCTVCSATFGMYRQFENHVYSAHSVVAKKVVDKKAAQAPKPGNEAPKEALQSAPQPAPKPAV